jgi:hypothetical protein
VAALAVPLLTMGAVPQEVEAKPKRKHVKKAIKKHHKQHYKRYHKPVKVKVKHSYPKYRSPYKKQDVENFGIYATPGGGIGFHYTEGTRYVPRHNYYPGYYW